MLARRDGARWLHWESARENMLIFDTLPRELRDCINELGPDAPEWVNDWYAYGADPGHRRE
jgi:hypothetical protein